MLVILQLLWNNSAYKAATADFVFILLLREYLLWKHTSSQVYYFMLCTAAAFLILLQNCFQMCVYVYQFKK